MLRGIKLSAKKLHAINRVPFVSPQRRNPAAVLPESKDVVGDHPIEQMKRIEEKIFGRKLF